MLRPLNHTCYTILEEEVVSKQPENKSRYKPKALDTGAIEQMRETFQSEEAKRWSSETNISVNVRFKQL